MFCAGCGSQIQSGLNYCSRCGRRVADDSKPVKAARTNALVIAGNTAGVGFVGFIFILLILTKNAVLPNLFIPITFFYFLALFGICFMILRMGIAAERGSPATTSGDQAPVEAYLGPVTTSQLEEGREMGIGSVTDATTRTLDEAKVGRT